MTTKVARIIVCIALIFSILSLASVSALKIDSAGTIGFFGDNDATEVISSKPRLIVMTQADGSTTQATSESAICPTISEINGHKDVRVQNVVMTKNHAPNIAQAGTLTKDMKSVVAWYMYGGCGDNWLHIKAAKGASYTDASGIAVFNQAHYAGDSGTSCKNIPHADLPINILEKVSSLSIGQNDKLTLAAYATGEADTHNFEYYSCIYTSCDYDADGFTAQACGGTDTNDTNPTSEDTTAPSPITALTLVSKSASSLTWSWYNPADADFSHTLISINGVHVGNVSKGVNTYTASNLQPSTAYTISVRTVDNSSNINQNAVSRTDTTGILGDTTAPVITNIVTNPAMPFINNGSTQRISIQFNSSEYPVTSILLLYNSANALVTSQGPFTITATSGLPITFTIPGGMFNGTYTLKMSAADESGNTAIVTIGQFTVASGNGTNPGNDIMPPQSISNLAVADRTKNSITWSWTNPSDADFSHVILYLNGVNVANTSSQSYSATGLSADTSYTLTVHTADSRGNVNTTDVSSTAKTLPNTGDDGNSGSSSSKKKKKAANFADYEPIVEERPRVFTDDDVISLAPAEKSSLGIIPLLLLIGIALLLLILLLFLIFGSRDAEE